MSRRSAIRRTVTLLTAPVLLATVVAGAPAAAADDDSAVDWQKSFGKWLKMKGDLAVYTDAADDGIDGGTGQPIDTPGYADGTSFAIFETTLKKPGINALSKRQQAKATQPILGNQANPKPGQEWVFVAIHTSESLPAGVPGGVQLNMAFGGPGGPPFYAGSSLDSLAGNEQLVSAGATRSRVLPPG